MTGVIIAGGAGTRLRPLTYIRPKPMMPLANKPLLQYQIEYLRRNHITDVVLCLGGDIRSIRQYLGNGGQFGVRIACSVETRPLGTAGAVRYAEPYFQDDTLVVMNGDGLVDYDLSAMLRFHHDKGADATIGLAEVPRPTPCGIITVDSEKRITQFAEPDERTKKILAGQPLEETGTATVNSGVYIISRGALRRIPLGTQSSIEREFFPRLVEGSGKVYGFALHGYWLDIGDSGRYLEAHHDLLAGRVNARVLGRRAVGGYWAAGKVSVDPSADVLPGVHLGPESRIGPGVRIEGFATVGSGCVIGEGSVLDGCVLLESVVVGAGCQLRNCIVDRDSRIGDRVQLDDHSVVAAGSAVFASAR